MRTAPGAQLDDFADRLEPLLGVRPALNGLPDLFRVLFRAARDQKILAVIDEFPYLLPTAEAEADRELTAIASVWEEERDSSRLKLVLCGSLVAQMESLLAERGPLHGRLRPLQLAPVNFAKARLFMPGIPDPLKAFERFAVTGGMPRYLDVLGTPGSLADVVCERVLDPNGALFDEGRTILEELREPKTYFSILQELATGDKEIGEIAAAQRSEAARVAKYLRVLETMRLTDRRLPAGADPRSRTSHWHLRDQFLRFWFRFVFPFQSDLESGLSPRTLWDTEIAPALSDHVGNEFEEFARSWVRSTQGTTRVDAWWGNALDELRRTKQRTSEEIDIVGVARRRVTVVGEARWRTSAMSVDHLEEIETYKLPALRRSPLTVAARPRIVLLSRGGYTDGLRKAADGRDDLVLVDVPDALST